MAGPSRRYTREQMQEILRRALEQQASDGEEISHDELIDAAREVGLDPDAIEAAASEVNAQRSIADDDAERNARRRRGFYRHFGIYFIVCAALAALDILTTGGRAWFVLPIFWGIAVAIHAMTAFFPRRESPGERAIRIEKQARREAKLKEIADARARRTAKREARRQRKAAIRNGAEQFETAVEQGVSLLLKGIAQQVKKGVETAARELAADDIRPPLGSHPDDDARLRSSGRDGVAPPPSLVRVDLDRKGRGTQESGRDEDEDERVDARRGDRTRRSR